MIRHVVFFKFKPAVTEDEIKRLEEGLGALPRLIAEIKGYEFGRDVVRSERAYDFALISTFDNMESLGRYISHEEHRKVLKLVGEICDSVKSVDFEI